MLRKAILILLVILTIAMLTVTMLASFVAGVLAQTKYVPPEYTADGTPLSACLDPACTPMLWEWPAGAVHKTNLVGVRYQWWSPVVGFSYVAPKSLTRCTVNYWSADTLHVGALLHYSGYQDPRRSLMPGVQSDSESTIRRGGAQITSMPADSVYEGIAWIIVGNPTWVRDDSLATYFRLVHERYRL